MDPTELTAAGAFVFAIFSTALAFVAKQKSNKSSIPPAAMSQVEDIKNTQDKMDTRLRKVEHTVIAIATKMDIPPVDTY